MQEVTINKLESAVTDIRINNCNKVIVTNESIKHLSNLRFFTVKDVKDLQLQYRALNWCGALECNPDFSTFEHPSLDITIQNTTISEIQSYVFSERIRNILLERVNIKRLKAYAFTNLKSTKKLEILLSNISGIEAQAFKKFYVEYLTIINSNFETIPSRMFAEIEVSEKFEIHRSNFTTIKPLGFIIKYPKTVEILNSQFGELEGDSFRVMTKGQVTIKNNYFHKLHSGALKGFHIANEPRLALPDLLFVNNTLNELKRDTLDFNRTSFIPKVGSITINQTCTCIDVNIWQSNAGFEVDIHCLVQSGRAKALINASLFKKTNCNIVSNTWVVIVIVVLVVFLIIVCVVLYFIYRRYKTNKQKEYVNRGRNKAGSLGLIVPDGRTYKETELHVIVEKAELLTTEL